MVTILASVVLLLQWAVTALQTGAEPSVAAVVPVVYLQPAFAGNIVNKLMFLVRGAVKARLAGMTLLLPNLATRFNPRVVPYSAYLDENLLVTTLRNHGVRVALTPPPANAKQITFTYRQSVALFTTERSFVAGFKRLLALAAGNGTEHIIFRDAAEWSMVFGPASRSLMDALVPQIILNEELAALAEQAIANLGGPGQYDAVHFRAEGDWCRRRDAFACKDETSRCAVSTLPLAESHDQWRPIFVASGMLCETINALPVLQDPTHRKWTCLSQLVTADVVRIRAASEYNYAKALVELFVLASARLFTGAMYSSFSFWAMLRRYHTGLPLQQNRVYYSAKATTEFRQNDVRHVLCFGFPCGYRPPHPARGCFYLGPSNITTTCY
eukprot:NODE_514_length_1331_cov_328.093604_g371_i0.p1 GENE.NODE_514_length_1331_cov_328.093604_g371_i0~~NODE_514_length_1331_cov_328.093604_g371_i0.p1  ORF type:complete len:384 (-),score=82.19 NODE_514_length_1331_cov_328.093604_g371_i0:91-1242(-)